MNTHRQEVRIEGGAQKTQAADGLHYVIIGLGIMGASFTLPLLDADGAETFVDQFAQNVKDVAAEVRRLNVGLIVPGVPAPSGGIADLRHLRILRDK